MMVLTYRSPVDKDDQLAAVQEALKAGYRHIDTARGKSIKFSDQIGFM
jgi:aryl-alcohol dehydrogenase-like predicted oxidoreductase